MQTVKPLFSHLFYRLQASIFNLILLLIYPYAHHQPDAKHIQQQGSSAVADEGQRNPRHRHQTDHHADIFKNLKDEHGYDADDDIGAPQVKALEGDENHPVYQQEVEQQQDR